MTTTWRAIESAPKDGTRVLLRWGATVTEGSWDHGDAQCWRTFAAGWIRAVTPTEWQPLPSPPPNEDMK